MIIQPSHDATIEPTSKVYENGAEFALQALLIWLNKEKFAVEQTGEESSLTIERIDEESGLTIERISENTSLTTNPTKSPEQAAQLAPETGEDPWFSEPKNTPDSQPKPSESAHPDRLEISKIEPPKPEESTRLLYGIKDGKLVNNLSRTEALAVAAMINGQPGSAIANGANLRIKFNGKVIAETDAKGNLITNQVYGNIPKADLIEFNNRIAKIAETPIIDVPAVDAVAKNLDRAPQTPGKTFLQRLLPPYGKRQQTLTPEQEVIKEHLAQSPTKNEYAFKNVPQGDIVFVKTAIAFTEANTSPGKPLISPKGYVVSSELNRDRTITYQYKTPDGKVAIEVTKTPGTGMLTIHQCKLTTETRQYLKDLQTTLDRPPVNLAQTSTLIGNETINLNQLKPEQLIKHLDKIEAAVEPKINTQTAQPEPTENSQQSIGKPIERELAEVKAAKAATAKAKREEKKAQTAAAEAKQTPTAIAPQVEVLPQTASVAVETNSEPSVSTPTKKEQLVAQGKATRASKTNTPKAPTKAKTAAKGGRG
jgi:hypothetical protein